MLKPFEQAIYVTSPFLPPYEEFAKGIKEIWENKWLTNNGPIVKRFEKRLEEYFDNKNICLFNNGTMALQIALQGLGLSGDVITTPFSFVATTHALYWNKLYPVFSDIEEDYFTLDPKKVEEKITPWTTAILAVHVFGHPCKLDELQAIADKHKIKLIYDAAHSFGVRVNDKSIDKFGDISMFSFHATKLFHTFEGGMLSFKNRNLKKKLNYLKNFGFEGQFEVVMPGTNAKMNEIQALMGLAVLEYMDEIIKKRKKIYNIYRTRLKEIPGIITVKEHSNNVVYNYAYLPIRINEADYGISSFDLFEKLKEYNVFTRKYFYPLIPDFSCYKSLQIVDELTVARKVAEEILTLPIYPDLALDDVHKICNIIEEIRKKKKI